MGGGGSLRRPDCWSMQKQNVFVFVTISDALHKKSGALPSLLWTVCDWSKLVVGESVIGQAFPGPQLSHHNFSYYIMQ